MILRLCQALNLLKICKIGENVDKMLDMRLDKKEIEKNILQLQSKVVNDENI